MSLPTVREMISYSFHVIVNVSKVYKCCWCKELWEGMISCSFLSDNRKH